MESKVILCINHDCRPRFTITRSPINKLDCFTKIQITKAVSQVGVHLNIKDEIQITAFTIKAQPARYYELM